MADTHTWEIAIGEGEVPPICYWINDLGGPGEITTLNIFELIQSRNTGIPPEGYDFVPTTLEIFGCIQYRNGNWEGGDASTGCGFSVMGAGCTEGEIKCIGTDQYICEGGEWHLYNPGACSIPPELPMEVVGVNIEPDEHYIYIQIPPVIINSINPKRMCFQGAFPLYDAPHWQIWVSYQGEQTEVGYGFRPVFLPYGTSACIESFFEYWMYFGPDPREFLEQLVDEIILKMSSPISNLRPTSCEFTLDYILR